MAARNKDVRREWIVFGFHCRQLGLDITYRRYSGPLYLCGRGDARFTHAALRWHDNKR
jgi:hypothetical protein